MIPGEVITLAGDIELNVARRTHTVTVSNTGDRPIQVGSHYHFFETNGALQFERAPTRGMRLNIAAGTAVRFEPGQSRTVELVEVAGGKAIYGFRGLVMGPLGKTPAARKAVAKADAAAKPATRKSAVSKPAAKKPAAKKPAVRKAAAKARGARS